MEIFVVALVVFVLAVLGMAIGVIFGKRCIRGSCGGLAGLRDRSGKAVCEHCPSHTADDTESSFEETDDTVDTAEQDEQRHERHPPRPARR
jgi:hypothetical protein